MSIKVCRVCEIRAGGLVSETHPMIPWPEPDLCPDCAKSATKVVGYADLADNDEDRRISIIGQTVLNHRKVVAVVTDDEPGKAERYIAKLLVRFPGIQIIERLIGPVANTVTIRVGPPAPTNN